MSTDLNVNAWLLWLRVPCTEHVVTFSFTCFWSLRCEIFASIHNSWELLESIKMSTDIILIRWLDISSFTDSGSSSVFGNLEALSFFTLAVSILEALVPEALELSLSCLNALILSPHVSEALGLVHLGAVVNHGFFIVECLSVSTFVKICAWLNWFWTSWSSWSFPSALSNVAASILRDVLADISRSGNFGVLSISLFFALE